MKKLLLLVFGLVLLPSQTVGQVNYAYQVTGSFTAPVSSSGYRIISSGAAFHKITWNDSGTVSTCTIAIDSSADGTSWSAGGVIAGQTCTSNGNFTSASIVPNYVRITFTALSGGGTVFVNLTGYINNPAGGGGGTGTINNANQFSLPYYSTVGSSNTLDGVAGPTTPNSVPQFWVTIPSGGVATAPMPQLAGVAVNAQTGTSYTLVAADRATEITQSNGSASAYTLPQAGSTGFTNNFVAAFTNIGAGLVTLTPTTSTVNGGATQIVPQNWHSFIYSNPSGNGAYRMPVMPTIQAFPSCADSGGNHLNFTTATGALSCGTSSSGGGGNVPVTFSSSAQAWSVGGFFPPGYSTGFGSAQAAYIGVAGHITDFYVVLTAAPGAGTSVTFTIDTGTTYGTLSDTAAACTVSGTSQTCSITGQSIATTATTFWSIKVTGVTGVPAVSALYATGVLGP